MIMDRSYQLRLDPDDNNVFLVTAPQFPEVTTCGSTTEEALQNGLRAIEEALAARIHAHADVPLPGEVHRGLSVDLSLQSFLKLGLYVICRVRGLTPAELSRRLDVHREQVDRLFRLDRNSRLNQLEAAYKALDIPLSLKIGEGPRWESER